MKYLYQIHKFESHKRVNDMTLFFQVLFHRPLFKDLFNEYTSDSKRVSLYEFQKFLAKEQGISMVNCFLI